MESSIIWQKRNAEGRGELGLQPLFIDPWETQRIGGNHWTFQGAQTCVAASFCPEKRYWSFGEPFEGAYLGDDS